MKTPLIIGTEYKTKQGEKVKFLGLQDVKGFGFFTSGPDTFFGLKLSEISGTWKTKFTPAPLQALRKACSKGEPVLEVQKFTVIAVSSNTNAFGLKSIIILAATGEGWEILKSPYGGEELPVRGDTVQRVGGRFACRSYECPRQLPSCKPALAVKVIADAIPETWEEKELRANAFLGAGPSF